jgi:uncharacterized protein
MPGQLALRISILSDPVVNYVFLCGSAFLAGAINSVAGGGTLLTFPALFHALAGHGEMAGVLANGTSTVALMPGSIAGAWGYRRELADKRAVLMRLIWPSLIGGAAGALLVTTLPGKIFNALVPWLILTAALLFSLQKPLQRWIGGRHSEGPPAGGTTLMVTGFQLLVALYGGYFGAGIGILMLSSLAFMAVGDIHHMNGIKTVLAAVINGVAVIVFIIQEKVQWNFAAAMAVAAIAGGYLGARIARRMDPTYVRTIVIAIGFGLSAYYFWQQFR